MIINLRKDDFEIVGEFADVCAHVVKTCLYQARIGRTRHIMDSQRTGSSRTVTKSTDCATKKCWRDEGSHLQCTSDYGQFCHGGYKASACNLGL